ncbi:MAG: glucosamine-6-phosphate deaminase [Kiritimatiellae bacterium]|nr:glucosamine-6-phosphate deaminase [Kiritimatiellia bacterium]
MLLEPIKDYAAMSSAGASILFGEAMSRLSRGERFNLGLATGNTMIALYDELAAKFNRAKADLSLLSTWNLDEYSLDGKSAVPRDHPLSYWKYMHEMLFAKLDPSLGFREENAHFPDPASPEAYDPAIAAAGGLDLQLLGIGFNGHIAFNEPMGEDEISVEEFARLPTRVLPLSQETIVQNTHVTAGGDSSLVPRYAATMGMAPILAAKKCLLLACFEEQTAPMKAIIAKGRPTPFLPASYLWEHPEFRLVYTMDKIRLGSI